MIRNFLSDQMFFRLSRAFPIISNYHDDQEIVKIVDLQATASADSMTQRCCRISPDRRNIMLSGGGGGGSWSVLFIIPHKCRRVSW